MTGLVGANPLVFYLNRADLLSWVDMGKTGTGFSGICHHHSIFNGPIAPPPLLRIHTYRRVRFSRESHEPQMNLIHPMQRYDAQPPDKDPIEGRYGGYFCEMKIDPRPRVSGACAQGRRLYLRPMSRSGAEELREVSYVRLSPPIHKRE